MGWIGIFEFQHFGLISSEWGGTRIEPWSTQESLDACGVEDFDGGPDYPQGTNKALYNAMIHPLIKLSVYGALWYQGERLGVEFCKSSAMFCFR